MLAVITDVIFFIISKLRKSLDSSALTRRLSKIFLQKTKYQQLLKDILKDLDEKAW